MNHAEPPHAESAALEPVEGWHCLHLYYRFRREVLATLTADARQAGRTQLAAALDPTAEGAPTRMQVAIVSGHKADFSLVLLDPNPLKLDRVHQAVLAGPLGPAIEPTYSFVSMTEVSEYVPTVAQYAERLVQDGEQVGSPAYQAKVSAYERREPLMRRQRLMPDLPTWPALCFYPMNKRRGEVENWFTLPFAGRNRMMAEHARSGMAFAGKVSQLITVGIGLEDWEWGVTLWATNPQYLKDIVYRMRFDEASARYAEFGPFYTSYTASADQILDHCQIS